MNISSSIAPQRCCFRRFARASFAQYGAKFLLNSRTVETLDGDWQPSGVVVVEFENYEQAKKFYDSPEYQAVIKQRFDSADSAVILVDGD